MKSRRTFLGAMLATALVRPAHAEPLSPTLQATLNAYARGAPLREGRVKLDVAVLVDNGNSVPITITAQSPMTSADYVSRIAVFTEKNPQTDVGIFQLSPVNGLARVSTRIRLASTQKLVAIATMSDGQFWTHTVEVVVTLAACIEE